MQLGSSIDSFPFFTRLNPCIAHCSTDSIPWVHHSREERSLDYDSGFVRFQIHMNFDTIIYCQQARMPGFHALASPVRARRGATPRRAARAVRHGGLAGQKLGRGTALGCTVQACTRARGASTWLAGTSSTLPVRRGATPCAITCKNMLGTKPGSHTEASCAATVSSGRRSP
jgi:hypothetical protein